LRYRLTVAAEKDLSAIARDTLRQFGPEQTRRYGALINEAISSVAADPDRASTRPRDELGAGVRSFHVGLAASRRSAAAHVLYYLVRGDVVIVLRVLGDGMEPKARVALASRQAQP